MSGVVSGRRAVVCGVVSLAIAAGACTTSGRPGGHPVRHAHASAAVPPQRHRHTRVAQLVIEASGDLLIHDTIYERALVLGGPIDPA